MIPPIASCRRVVGPALWAALACCALTPHHVVADEPDLELLEQEAFRAAVDRVAPSVVRIETVGGLERVGRVLFGTGPTTGLVVDKEGYIVSSAFNFVNRPASILVRLPDDTLKPASLVATDHNRMLVLLKIDPDTPLPVPEIVPAAEMRVGQWAVAVGRTFEGNRPNMAVGILSALGRVWGKAIQTDAVVSPNNYGGPLIDIRGRVLGVIVPLSPQSAQEIAGVQWYDSGIGFAIEAEHVLKILPRLKQGEDLHPGVIGISLRGRNPSIGEPVIAACRPNSPAAKAGLKPGDRIVEIDGREIVRAAGVKEALARRYAGAKVSMVVLRDEQRLRRDLELLAKLPPYEHAFLGILPMRAPGGESGVAVRYVYPDGPAARAGLEPGDVLVSLEGKPVQDRDELLRRTGALPPDAEVELEVRHGGQSRKLKLRLGRLPEELPPEQLPPARAKDEAQPRRFPRIAVRLCHALLASARTQTTSGRLLRIASPWVRAPLRAVLARFPLLGGDRPRVGTIPLTIPGVDKEPRAYVPEAYDPAVPHGVVVWLHAPGGFDWDALLARWKPHCDRDDLILLAPEVADAKGWKPGDVTLVKQWLDEIHRDYTVDAARVVLHGHEGGGALAYAAAGRNREVVRAVAVVDAQMTGNLPELDPLHRTAVYVATAKQSRRAALVTSTIARIRELKIPVTVKDLGEKPRYLNDGELAELVRWIDMLDRI